MITKKAYLAICLLLTGTMTIKAQTDESLKHTIRDKALNVIEKGYETYATINDEESKAAFMALFVNERAIVYNDLLGLSDAPQLTATAYARLLGSQDVRNKIIFVKNITVSSEPQLQDGKWKVTIAFDKEISYYNACGVFYSSKEFYEADYKLKAVMVYDENSQNCLIERITGRVETYNELPETYFVVMTNDDNKLLDNKLLYKNIPLKFNSVRQAIVEGVPNLDDFSNSDQKVKAVIPTYDKDCKIVTIDYGRSAPIGPAPSYRMKLHFDLPMGGSLSIDEGSNKLDNTSSSGFEFGIDAGMKLFDNKGVRLYGFTGLGISSSTIELSSKKDYTIAGQKDLDGSDYTRHYENLNITQKVSLTELIIPVYANLEYAFSSDMALYGSLGLRLCLNMSNKLEDNGSYANSVYGIYTGNDGFGKNKDDVLKWAEAVGKNMELGQNANGFSKDKVNFSSATLSDLDGVKSTNIDALFGLGFRYTIPKSPITIDLGANMVFGLGDLIEPSGSSNSSTMDNTKPIYNMIDANTHKSTEYINSLTDQLKSVKRQSLRLSIGLIYNL